MNYFSLHYKFMSLKGKLLMEINALEMTASNTLNTCRRINNKAKVGVRSRIRFELFDGPLQEAQGLESSPLEGPQSTSINLIMSLSTLPRSNCSMSNADIQKNLDFSVCCLYFILLFRFYINSLCSVCV